MYSLFKSF